MSLALAAILSAIGVIGGFSAGLLGFGGGVLMFPLLYYVPPLFGFDRFDAKTVAAVIVSQVFFSTFIGGLVHRRSGHVHGRLALVAGSISALGALLGSVATRWIPEPYLVVIFGLVTVVALLIMLLPAPDHGQEQTAGSISKLAATPLAIGSLAIGIVVGLLGAGNFIFVPFLIYVLRLPTRIAIGSSLLIAMMNSASGFIGKLVTAQIPLLMTTLLVIGGTLGALIGERVHRHLSVTSLRYVYAWMVALIAVRVWLGILVFEE